MNSATPYIKSKWRILFLFVGLGFLYLPILILMAYSFNSSRLVTVWKSFSFHWYEALVQDEEFLHAIYLTFSIGFCAATMSVIIGTLAAFVLTRFNRFKGYGIFSFSITAPMIMPEVITGLSLLLMFIAMSNGSHALVQYLLESFNIQEGNFLYPFLMQLDGFPNRGVVTIWIAMVTFTSAYVTVIVRARLKETDLSIEECIERYLDAKRSVLLFSKGVILVEGDAEEILIPALVKQTLGVSLDELGIGVINVGSVSFEYIASVFGDERIRRHCSIITDLDAQVEGAHKGSEGAEQRGISNTRLLSEDADERYIELISNLFNNYIFARGHSISGISIDTAKFVKNDAFDLNVDNISNSTTRKLIEENPEFKSVYQIILGSFRKKRTASNIITPSVVDSFNKVVDEINEIINKEDDKGFKTFFDYLNIQSSKNDEN